MTDASCRGMSMCTGSTWFIFYFFLCNRFPLFKHEIAISVSLYHNKRIGPAVLNSS